MIGRTLGHYQILAKIGEGGMGAVYRARDEVLHRDVAIKVLSSRATEESAARDQLLREARASSALNHPNICTVHEVGSAGGESYIVMELVEGRPFNEMIGTHGLPIESVLRYAVQIASALAHAHGRKVIHRDLKSANIVVTSEGLVKVLDFGLARRTHPEVVDDATRTIESTSRAQDTAISGTLAYMPPEVLRGQSGDERSDLWALGVILYHAASGGLPFQGQTSFELSAAILNGLPSPLPSRVPSGLGAIVQRCLMKEPAQRYQSAGEIRAALEILQSASLAAPARPADAPSGARTTVLRGVQHVHVKKGDVLLLIGTLKGAFLLRSSNRTRWELGGPYFHGHSVFSMAYDGRAGRHRIWAATESLLWGTFLRSSDDFGVTWTNPVEANLKFPPDTATSLKNIWQITLGHSDEPDVLYCGVEPAALFESRDAGETWSLVRGLFDHPHRPRWMPGNGGLILHTILLDAAHKDRIYVAISAGGVYRTDDRGQTWKACNRGVRVVFMPEKYPEFGQCVHKIALHPHYPERLFLQNHWGLYRSDDAGENWEDIANGVPSDFGFPIVMHPQNPNCVYVLPVDSDEFRCTRDGRLRVYRTRNGGNSWEALTRGLPQKGAYVTVLRDSMAADVLAPAGIYFGTRSGELYGSIDEGKSWKKILDGLPSITCVKAAVYGEPRTPRKSPVTKRRTQHSSAASGRRSRRKVRRSRGR